MMNRAHLLSAILGLSASLLVSSPVLAQTVADPFQRYMHFFNELTVPIFPVIQAPVTANCGPPGDTSLLRIFVNDRQRGAGIPSGGNVKIALPKTQPCDKGGFYNAARIFVLLANAEQFESVIEPAQRTTDLQVPWAKDVCPNNDDQNPACWVGKAGGAYLGDMPGQLLEYTVISQVRGAESPNGPNDPNGTPFLDYDVSYVDDAYLPVTMSLGDGVAPYMGSSLLSPVFNQRLTAFLHDPATQWSSYAAFSEANWPHTVFQHLVPRTDKLPSGDIVVAATRTGGTSSYYVATARPDDPVECNAPPPRNQQCSAPPDQGGDGLTTGDCCPNPNGVVLGCCDALAFLIDGTLKTFVPNLTPALRKTTQANRTLADIVERWRHWREKGPDCQQQPPLGPVVPAQQAEFCTAFESTFNFIWREFASRGGCAQRRDSASDECIVSSIIGYTISQADKDKCLKCPTDCPAECLLDTQRSVCVSEARAEGARGRAGGRGT